MESHISAPTNPSAILATPPPSVIPNMVNPESRAWQVYVTAAICGILVLLFNIIQIYTRFFIMKRIWFDDCKLLIAYYLPFWFDSNCYQMHR